jgi:hypothetical protein
VGSQIKGDLLFSRTLISCSYLAAEIVPSEKQAGCSSVRRCSVVSATPFCLRDSCTSCESRDVIRIAACSQRRCCPAIAYKRKRSLRCTFLRRFGVPYFCPPPPPSYSSREKKKHFGEKPTLNPPAPRFNVPSGGRVQWPVEMVERLAGGNEDMHAVLTMRNVGIDSRKMWDGGLWLTQRTARRTLTL